MVLCEDVRDNKKQVDVKLITSNVFCCEHKFYTIDPDFVADSKSLFDVTALRMANPHEDSLYTMFYVEQEDEDYDEYEDGPVSEAVHPRWRPTLQEMVDFIENGEWSSEDRACIKGILGLHWDYVCRVVLPSVQRMLMAPGVLIESDTQVPIEVRAAAVNSDFVSGLETKTRLFEAACHNALELLQELKRDQKCCSVLLSV